MYNEELKIRKYAPIVESIWGLAILVCSCAFVFVGI